MRVEVRSPSGPREELPYEPPEDVECINFGVGVDPVEPRGHLAEFRTLRGSPGRAIERAKESASLVLLLLQAVHGRGFYGSTPRGPLRWAIRGTFRSTLPASGNRKSAIHRRGVTRQSPSGVPKPFLRARHFSSLLHRGVHETGLGVPLSRRSGSTPPCSGPPSSSGPRRRSSR